MCLYLAKRNSTYYFRRPIPSELQPFFQREGQARPPAAFMFSLGVKDKEAAKRLRTAEIARTDALLDEARAMLADAADCAAAPEPAPALTEAEQEAAEFQRREEEARMERWRARAADRDAARALLPEKTERLSREARAWRDLLRAEQQGRELEVARLKAQLERLENGSQGVAPTASQPQRKAASLTFEKLLTDYVAERANLAPRGVASMQTHVRSLAAFTSHADARQLTAEDVVAWKNWLLKEGGKGGRPLAAKTVNDNYLATIRSVMGWAVSNRLVTANPCEGIRVAVRGAPRTRDRGYSDAEAVRVLAATRVDRPGLSREYQLACKWVPWLLAYTGARVGEIAQLRAEDVRQEGGHWVLTLTPEAGSVKTGEFRFVPLHPHLVEMGFPAVATQKKMGPLFYAPERRQTKTGSKALAEKVGEKVRAVVREAGVQIAQPNHAWRHRFKTKARLYGIDLQAADVLQGHASDTEGQRYGVWPIPRLAAEVAKLPRYEVAD